MFGWHRITFLVVMPALVAGIFLRKGDVLMVPPRAEGQACMVNDCVDGPHRG